MTNFRNSNDETEGTGRLRAFTHNFGRSQLVVGMNAIRIKRHLDSDTLHLPEVRGMVGKEVEIIILEEQAPAGGGDLSLLEQAAKDDLIDPDALKELRDASMI